MLRRHWLRLLAGIAAPALLLFTLGGIAAAKPPGKGQEKVVLCHKGKVTIRVGGPAVKAHLRHGDRHGRCNGLPEPVPGSAQLAVVKQVVNDSGGTKTATNFTITINGVVAVGGNTFAGSSAGVTRTITTFGAYSATEASVTGYALTGSSAGCSGTIQPGQHKLCVLVNDDVPATLTVVKQVTNNSGGTKTAANFTITINGVVAVGGNTFAGSAAGVTRTLASVGAYTVTEAAVVGYALQSASADCSGTIALGEHKTCVLTNNDV